MSRQRYKATFDGTRFEGKAEMHKARAATVTFGVEGAPRELTRRELDRAARIAAHTFGFTVTRVLAVVQESSP